MVGQCYDGAANMSGCIKGLSILVLKNHEKALYVHCHGHKLNLGIESAFNQLPYLREVFCIMNTFYDFVEGSGQRHALFQHLQGDHSTTLKKLNPTRWCSRSATFDAISKTFPHLLIFFEVY